MRVDLWCTYRHMPTAEVGLEDSYRHRAQSHVVIAETWDEVAYLESMQFLLGAEMNIRHKADMPFTMPQLLAAFWEVYTTWDPKDRNRI